jgi:regulator of protease activity HflC (stomatin/prohibitin superfamily)
MTRRDESPSALRDPYRGVVFVLLAATLLGTAGAAAGGLALANRVLLDAAVTLAISSGILIGVALAQSRRAGERTLAGEAPRSPAAEEPASTEEERSPAARVSTATSGARVVSRWIEWPREVDAMDTARGVTAAAGFLAVGLVLLLDLAPVPPRPLTAGLAAALCLAAAGLAATAARYLADVDTERLPEGPGLCRAARLVAWVLVLAALSMGFAWAGQRAALEGLHLAILLTNVALAYGLLTAPSEGGARRTFPLDLAVLSLLGSRANVLASVLDAAQRQLGIDLRSTWALTVVRRSAEPLLIGLCLLAWLSTCLTVVGVQEEGLTERFGVPVEGPQLRPGLHLHWPWPVDRVFRIPVQRVQSLGVGHGGEEEGGPENVLWARQHAPQEYTLLLGNGRDLIAVDAALQFRIADARAWRYHCQNPAAALRAIAYRAVMRSTVNRTLAEALSENVVTLTAQMRAMVQREADALGLGVELVAFTVGGMHPPVPVAPDYQAVVSAELRKVTAVVKAQVYRNQTVPAAEAAAIVSTNTARADEATDLGRAAGEAWSFRTLESQYRAAPQEYSFRRRLETIEKSLAGRRFTVVDARIQRDGGELWLLP